MNNNEQSFKPEIMKSEKKITAIVVFILIAALIATGIFYTSNKSTTKNLNAEKLKSEMLLSEKLALQKEIESFKNQINSLVGKNTELDKLLAETSQKLSEKEAQLGRIARENGNIKVLKKQIAELEQLKKDFENQVITLNQEIKKMDEEKDEMSQTIASLKEKNKELQENLDIISSITGDNYLVQTTKRNDRLTVMAKRTKKMTMSFCVPEDMVENISFKLTKPDGTQLNERENGIEYRVAVGDEDLLTKPFVNGEIKISKKIEMTWEPKQKQKPGIYKIEIYNGEKYIGACNVKLR